MKALCIIKLPAIILECWLVFRFDPLKGNFVSISYDIIAMGAEKCDAGERFTGIVPLAAVLHQHSIALRTPGIRAEVVTAIEEAGIRFTREMLTHEGRVALAVLGARHELCGVAHG